MLSFKSVFFIERQDTRMNFKQKLVLCFFTVAVLLFAVLLGPMDIFSHGLFYDDLDFNTVASDLQGAVRLEDGDYEMKFMPVKKHLAGFRINLINQPDNNTGLLILTVLNIRGGVVDEISVDLSKVTATEWYTAELNTQLKKGEEYVLRFSTDNCNTIPYLMTIDSAYHRPETLTGNVLITKTSHSKNGDRTLKTQ